MPEFDPNALGTPNRGTSEGSLDQWNRAMRQSAVYQDFMRRNGLPTDGRVRLSRAQQAQLEAHLRAEGFRIPSGMHIDQGGNLNQKNTLVRNSLIGAGVAGGGLAALGAAGVGPFAGLVGGGGASGAAGTGGSLAPIAGGAPWAVTPYAGTAAMAPTGAAAAGGSVGAGALGTMAGGAGGAGRELFAGMTARDLAALGLGVGGAIGGAMSDRPNLNPNTQTTDPNLQKLLATMQGRLDKSEPLYDSIMAMANGLLPTRYQKGGGGMP